MPLLNFLQRSEKSDESDTPAALRRLAEMLNPKTRPADSEAAGSEPEERSSESGDSLASSPDPSPDPSPGSGLDVLQPQPDQPASSLRTGDVSEELDRGDSEATAATRELAAPQHDELQHEMTAQLEGRRGGEGHRRK